MIDQATIVTPEQVTAFIGVVGVLVMANLGQVMSWALRAYKRKIKGDFDLNEAFKRIRTIENELKTIKEEKKT